MKFQLWLKLPPTRGCHFSQSRMMILNNRKLPFFHIIDNNELIFRSRKHTALLIHNNLHDNTLTQIQSPNIASAMMH